jgi:hypothetical protein
MTDQQLAPMHSRLIGDDLHEMKAWIGFTKDSNAAIIVSLHKISRGFSAGTVICTMIIQGDDDQLAWLCYSATGMNSDFLIAFGCNLGTVTPGDVRYLYMTTG